jgi:hypothetical protein
VIGEASIETPKAIAEPVVKVTTLSAKVAESLLNLIEGCSGWSEGLFSINAHFSFFDIRVYL